MLGLLTITAIPTTIGIAEGVSAQKQQKQDASDANLLRKFTLNCWCEGKGKLREQVHGGQLMLRDGKVWIQCPLREPVQPLHPFVGFYIAYPDDERPLPAPMGLVSTVSDDPPMLNWIYVHNSTLELKHGNRTQSREHCVGDWKWTSSQDEDDHDVSDEEPGGLTLNGEEKFVVVEPVKDNDEDDRWEVRWDRDDNGLKGVAGIEGRKVLQVSFERTFLEEKKTPVTSHGTK
ncbi:hypothetical protein MMC13_008311 [Lambiella insularis]|nr:hypothetical protein [Lambiella insularis]